MYYCNIPRKHKIPFEERKTFPVATSVTYDVYKFLRTESSSKGVSVAAMIRLILQEYYEKNL